MIPNKKNIETLQIGDLKANPVWQYTDSGSDGDTVVYPVKKVPVKSLTGKEVGTQVSLANGNVVWALIGNVDVGNPRLTEHFLTLSVEKDGLWFTLARYHDFDYAQRGPAALAQFLGLPVDGVFPIAYDITQFVSGDPAGLSGTILREPREKLTRAEIIAMAVP
jgi:hypothetical protein